jgi:hypothetical protein
MKLCSFCGASEPDNALQPQLFQSHHLAGFANHPFWTATVCPDCHPIFSGWQYAQRIPLRSKNKQSSRGKHIPKDWGDREIPEEIRFQAILRGLEQAYSMTMLYAGCGESLKQVKLLIQNIIRFHPDMMKGSTFGEHGEFARLKVKYAVPLTRIRTQNVQRINAAIFGMIAFLIEESLGEDHQLSIRLRTMEHNPQLLSDIEPPNEEIILSGSVESIIGELCMTYLNRHQRRALAATGRKASRKDYL